MAGPGKGMVKRGKRGARIGTVSGGRLPTAIGRWDWSESDAKQIGRDHDAEVSKQ